MIDDITTDPVKEAVTNGILKFLCQRNTKESPTGGAIQRRKDVVYLAEAYSSGKYGESAKEGMLKAGAITIIDPDWKAGEEIKHGIEEVAMLFENLPETDECYKFMFKAMKQVPKMDKEELPVS